MTPAIIVVAFALFTGVALGFLFRCWLGCERCDEIGLGPEDADRYITARARRSG